MRHPRRAAGASGTDASGADVPDADVSGAGAAAADDRAAATAALVALFREHQLALARTALMIVGDRATAEDVVQDAFVDLYRRIDRLTDHHRMLPYARAAVVNKCRTVLRRRKLAFRSGRTHEPPVWSAESAAMLGEERREVFLALRRLPQRRREALVLRYYLDLDEREIAEIMGIGVGTVRSTVSRALASLADLLGEES
ncbi:SigE family RNA polymerase sigma factor [Actinomadura verrucosospora]|uniref:ECF subfamily RNA polymerase sigma-24 subunit n=1 Tax=Actinomadura verrucosospora TaxID=46165 RepID=A0A7D4A889_ACTVE|nr:SigE family RNA polymerase sigma factor [Actinomadura verrucosospora]QKG24925.1 ECF subfamily RNA polymerase sigma-24 subunit [Actinomadura verrucosospora]